MNIYIKYWKPEDVDPELIQYYGFSTYKNENKLFKAWYLDLLSPKGLIILSFTNNHEEVKRYWGIDWKYHHDWQLFKD